MKESEKLLKEANREENDLKSLGLYKKALRQRRVEDFEVSLERLRVRGVNIVKKDETIYLINDTIMGNMTYYPKANKLHIHKSCKWVQSGLKWMINNLI